MKSVSSKMATKNILAHISKENAKIFGVLHATQSPIWYGVAWGLANYKDEAGESRGCGFYVTYNSIPTVSGCNELEIFLHCGHLQSLALNVDGVAIPPEAITRLSFFANSDIGLILASYQPGIFEDARELVMAISAKRKWNSVLQHLAVSWAYELFAKK